MKKASCLIAVALVVALLTAVPMPAQTSFGSITGLIRDSSGAVMPGVAITVTNDKTGTSRTATSDANGNYNVPSLLPAVYSVSAELKGFKKAVTTGATLEVNQTLRVDLTMEVGEVSQTVEVQAEAPLLQSESSTVGTVIENKQVVELPLNGRSFTELTYLVPGGVRQSTGIFQQSGTRVSVSGARSEDNNYTLDGVNNNETFFKAYGVQPSIDAIAEFKIQTNITSAEFGSAAGANINVATKSGTNAIHGGAWEFLRNNVFDANNFFDNKAGVNKPQFKQNQFGAQAGGPIMKNKAFWFFNYEGYRFRRGANSLGTIPTPAMFAGDLRFDETGKPGLPIYDPATTRIENGKVVRDPFPNNIIPTNRLDPIMQSYIQLFYPAPNLSGQTQNLINGQSNSLDWNQYIGRVDYKINDNNTLFGRWANNLSNAATARPLSPTSLQKNSFTNLMVSDTQLFGPTTVLDLKFSYHRNHLQIADTSPSDYATIQQWINTTGIQGIVIKNANVPLYPQFFISGYTNPNQDGYPFPDDTMQALVNLSKSKGRHYMKFGMDYQNRRNFDDGLFSANVDFLKAPTEDPQNIGGTGQAVASYILGLPTNALRNIGNTGVHMRWSGFYFYAQDDIHVNAKLTINLGLRYDYTQWPRDRDNNLGSQDNRTGEYLWAGQNLITGQAPNVFPTVIYPDKNNFAPRIGMAYLLNPTTTIRAGYGMFYNTNFLWEAQGIRGNWPYSISETFSNMNQGANLTYIKTAFPTYTSVYPGAPVPPSAQHIADRNRRVSYMQQFNVHLQKQVAGNIVLEAGYVGTFGSKASIFANFNTAQPGPGPVQPRRPYQNNNAVSLMTDIASSNYNGAQFKAEKRFSSGLSFMGTYTFSRMINTGGDGFSLSSSPQNPDCLECDKALSAFYHKNIWAMNWVYELPFGKGKKFGSGSNAVGNQVIGGWQINGIWTWGSGAPVNVQIPRDIANIGARSIGQRPNVNGNPNIGNQTIQNWFNTDVFSEPAPYTYGNAGRNIVQGPGYQYWTLGVFKNFWIKENYHIQFRAEFFNAFNHANFNNPDGNFDSPTFGQVLGSDYARQIQFGLKFNF